MRIRAFVPQDAEALYEVFHSSVHGLARDAYAPEQLAAWAPQAHDGEAWAARLVALRPFVAMMEDRVAGYATLQPSGYIGHFYVHAAFAGRGVGSALMRHLHDVAREERLIRFAADVSLAAEGFFLHHGFRIEERRLAIVRGVPLANARMTKALARATGDADS